MFLDDESMVALTGFKWKAKQIVELRRQGIPFRVNAAGKPVVTWSAVEGGKRAEVAQPKKWSPSWAGSQARI